MWLQGVPALMVWSSASQNLSPGKKKLKIKMCAHHTQRDTDGKSNWEWGISKVLELFGKVKSIWCAIYGTIIAGCIWIWTVNKCETLRESPTNGSTLSRCFLYWGELYIYMSCMQLELIGIWKRYVFIFSI